MQEVSELRRSLEDAEGLSRDARKEWAILRSQKISLEESAVGLSDGPPSRAFGNHRDGGVSPARLLRS